MSILDRADFYPIQMVFMAGYTTSQGTFFQFLDQPFANDIKKQLNLDCKHPYIEAFSQDIETIYCIGVWIIDKEPFHPVRAEEVLLNASADHIKTQYLAWLKESTRED